MSERQWRPECVICKESVELKEGKVDEYRTGYSRRVLRLQAGRKENCGATELHKALKYLVRPSFMGMGSRKARIHNR